MARRYKGPVERGKGEGGKGRRRRTGSFALKNATCSKSAKLNYNVRRKRQPQIISFPREQNPITKQNLHLIIPNFHKLHIFLFVYLFFIYSFIFFFFLLFLPLRFTKPFFFPRLLWSSHSFFFPLLSPLPSLFSSPTIIHLLPPFFYSASFFFSPPSILFSRAPWLAY